jgi:plastocyanin/uncharacterized membrane protein
MQTIIAICTLINLNKHKQNLRKRSTQTLEEENKMKKGMMALLAMIMVLAFGASAAWGAEMDHAKHAIVKSDMKLTLDNQSLKLDEAYLVDDSLFVPYRAFAEQIGGQVAWDEALRKVTVMRGGNKIELILDSSDATVNGVKVTMAGPAQLIGDSTFVHSRFLAEVFGITVNYDQATRSVNLVSSSASGLQVFGVAEGGVYNTDSLLISSAVYNLKLVDFMKNATAVAGEGHVHFWLDTDVNDPLIAFKQINTEPVKFDKVLPGDHTLTVVLQDNTHKALTPKVSKVIHFKTTAGNTPTAPAAPSTSTGKTYNIEISKFKFSQPEITVEAGSTIVFTNQDDVKHNAVADNGSFSTKLLGKGESAQITLSEPGEYTYYCAPHKANMKAKIIVN